MTAVNLDLFPQSVQRKTLPASSDPLACRPQAYTEPIEPQLFDTSAQLPPPS